MGEANSWKDRSEAKANVNFTGYVCLVRGFVNWFRALAGQSAFIPVVKISIAAAKVVGQPPSGRFRSVVRWSERQTSSSGRGDDSPRVLLVGGTLFDFPHEPRCLALHHLPHARLKLVQEIHSRVAANRRTKSFERC